MTKIDEYLWHKLSSLTDNGYAFAYETKAHLGAFISPDNCFRSDIINPSMQPIFLISFMHLRYGYSYFIITNGERYSYAIKYGEWSFRLEYHNDGTYESKKQVCDAIRELVNEQAPHV